MSLTTDIFVNNSKCHLSTIDKITIVVVSLFFGALIILSLHSFNNIIDLFLKFIAYSCIGVLFFLMLFYFAKRENLNGVFSGKITINKDEVQINDEIINIKEISRIEINIDDYLDKPINYIANIYTSSYSQGVKNFLKFETIEGKRHHIYFRLYNEFQRRDINPFVEQLIKYRKISFDDGFELLQLKSKQEIDELRKVLIE